MNSLELETWADLQSEMNRGLCLWDKRCLSDGTLAPFSIFIPGNVLLI